MMTEILYSFTFVTLAFINVWLNQGHLASQICTCTRSIYLSESLDKTMSP